MKVPQLSPWVGEEEYQAIKECFVNNWITEGPKSKEFEQKLLRLIGSKYGVLAPNGTLALYLGLKASGVGLGDEVLVPDFTFIASATSIEMTGATPVFVDVNRRNFQIDLSGARRLVTKKTKAIMPVHIYGTAANMDEVMDFARKYKLKVIEDAAEAVGVHWDGKHTGTFGDVGCFSFFADKTITTAEGGFVVTDSDEIYENLLYLRNQGRVNRGSFIHPRVGYNLRLTDIQSAVGLVQLAKLQKIKERKTHILALYKKLLSDISGITFFEPEERADFIPFRVCILHDKAHDLMSYLKSKDIEPRTFFYPLHRQPCFVHLKTNDHNNDSDFPNSVYGYDHGICLPVFPTLSDAQIKYICSTIKDFSEGEIFYKYYDAIFKTKDYLTETKVIFGLSKKYGIAKPKRILEIGSGTGNHTLELAKKVKDLVAIDIDSRMVRVGKEKIKNFGVKNVEMLCTSIEALTQNNFDLVTAMFNVVTYVDNYQALVSFMREVVQKLKTGGVFVFDAWNGVSAIIDPPKDKKTEVRVDGVKIENSLTSKTDNLAQKTILTYAITATKSKSKERGKYSFSQTLWMPNQIREAIEEVGLELVLMSPLMKPGKKVTDKDWKIMFCARKPKTVRK